MQILNPNICEFDPAELQTASSMPPPALLLKYAVSPGPGETWLFDPARSHQSDLIICTSDTAPANTTLDETWSYMSRSRTPPELAEPADAPRDTAGFKHYKHCDQCQARPGFDEDPVTGKFVETGRVDTCMAGACFGCVRIINATVKDWDSCDPHDFPAGHRAVVADIWVPDRKGIYDDRGMLVAVKRPRTGTVNALYAAAVLKVMAEYEGSKQGGALPKEWLLRSGVVWFVTREADKYLP